MEISKSHELTKIPMLPVWNTTGFPKPKLPKTFIWVTGVERLSKRFGDVPQFHNLSVWFSDNPFDTMPLARLTMTRIVAEKIPYSIFKVWYSTTRRGSPHWYFMVYPVKIELRHVVRGLFEEKVFSFVEQWMKKERTETWLYNQHHLHCIWNPMTEGITVQEE